MIGLVNLDELDVLAAVSVQALLKLVRNLVHYAYAKVGVRRQVPVDVAGACHRALLRTSTWRLPRHALRANIARAEIDGTKKYALPRTVTGCGVTGSFG